MWTVVPAYSQIFLLLVTQKEGPDYYPFHSLGFRLLVSEQPQSAGFPLGVPYDINAFHCSTISSADP